MKADQINSTLKITESFKLPETLMPILLDDDRRAAVFDQFMELGEPLDHDWFTDYFEEEHSNKSKMAQDFTPKGPADILGHILEGAESVADVCAGTGGLSISQLTKNPGITLHCYELSERAIPLLLFNLSIRNARATVTRCDILTGETFEAWTLTPGERYAHIEPTEPGPPPKVDAVISNPPYSLKYKQKDDPRFEKEIAEMLPSDKADFVFIFFALTLLKPGGRMAFVLPHGVLFRGRKEKTCRQYLLDSGYLKSIIGLPEKLFANTGIPVMIMEIDTNADAPGTFFIDAKELYTKGNKQNILDPEHVTKICEALDARKDVERFATLATLEEIQENDYNLNIPRYVDTFVPEPLPDFLETMEKLARLMNKRDDAERLLWEEAQDLYGTTPEVDNRLKEGLNIYEKIRKTNRTKSTI